MIKDSGIRLWTWSEWKFVGFEIIHSSNCFELFKNFWIFLRKKSYFRLSFRVTSNSEKSLKISTLSLKKCKKKFWKKLVLFWSRAFPGLPRLFRAIPGFPGRSRVFPGLPGPSRFLKLSHSFAIFFSTHDSISMICWGKYDYGYAILSPRGFIRVMSFPNKVEWIKQLPKKATCCDSTLEAHLIVGVEGGEVIVFDEDGNELVGI